MCSANASQSLSIRRQRRALVADRRTSYVNGRGGGNAISFWEVVQHAALGGQLRHCLARRAERLPCANGARRLAAAMSINPFKAASVCGGSGYKSRLRNPRPEPVWGLLLR